MLLSSVVIILREVLEGALLLSVFLALSWHQGYQFRWSLTALFAGVIGAVFYAAEFESISTWFDYVGQEVVNASLHFLIVLFLTMFSLFYTAYKGRYDRAKIIFMTIAVALTIVREGSEILLYLSGFVGRDEALSSVILGGIIGAGIGLSLGGLLYYSLIDFIPSYTRKVAYGLLALFSAAMLSDTVTMLTQADWLPAQHYLWDSSSWLAEESLLGHLLYALLGYEATPTALQLAAYITGLLLVLVLPRLFSKGVAFNGHK